METNRSWSIDDRRLNFQFGTEVGYEVKNGQLGRLLRNPTYTGIGPQFWSSMDMLSQRDRRLGHAQLRQGPARPDRPHRPSGGARPVPQRAGGGAGMTRRARTLAARPSSVATQALPGAEVVGAGRPAPARADPVRQLGDPPERRRGRDHRAARRPPRRADGVRLGQRRLRRRPARAGRAGRRRGRASPRWTRPGRGSPTPRAPGDTAGVDPATAGATPADRAAVVRAFVDGAGGLETAGYCRTNHWTGALRQLGRPVRHRRGRRVRPVRHRPQRRRRRPRPLTRRCASRELDGAALGARAAAKARAWTDPVELPPGRYEVVLEPTAVADILGNLAAHGFNGKAVNERTLVRPTSARTSSTRRCRSSTTRWPWGSGTTARARRARRLALVDCGPHRRASPTTAARPPRPVADQHRPPRRGGLRLRAGRPPPRPAAVRHRTRRRRRGRRAGRRLLGRRARRRRRARGPGLGLLVHPRARPAHPRAHRPDPQRRLADRGRRGHHAGAELPVHPVLRPGAGARATCSASGVRRPPSPATPTRPPRRAGPARPCTSRPGTSPAAPRAEPAPVTVIGEA